MMGRWAQRSIAALGRPTAAAFAVLGSVAVAALLRIGLEAGLGEANPDLLRSGLNALAS